MMRVKKTLETINLEKSSLVKELKKTAVNLISSESEERLSKSPEEKESKKIPPTKVVIEIISRNKEVKTVEIDLMDEIYQKKQPTLATILKKENIAETTCGEQLSCSTCVGDVQSSGDLPKQSEEEKDIIGTLKKEAMPGTSIRLTCQIPLRGGQKYTFTEIE